MKRLKAYALGLSGAALLVIAAFAAAGATARYPVLSAQSGREGEPEDPAGSASAAARPTALAEAMALGAFHVHTTASDGRGSVEDVAAAAREAGLDFVIITDHNVPGTEAPRYVEGVLVIFGVEVSTSDGHLVVLGASDPLAPARRRTGQQAVDWATGQGAFATLAHPVQRKNPWKDPEAGAEVPGFELYSADTLFRDAVASPLSRLLPSAMGWLGGGVHGVLGLVDAQPAPHAGLVSLPGHPVALCAHDAHGLPPYADVFGAMATAVPRALLVAAPQEAADLIVAAISEGRSTCVFQALGPPEGFALRLPAGAQTRQMRVGERLEVRLPPGAEHAHLKVWGPGRLEPDGHHVVAEGEGLLQVEVWLEAPGRLFGRESKPWLVPSPIRIVR